MRSKAYSVYPGDIGTKGAKVFIIPPLASIDTIEPQYDKIIIIVPNDISSINISFLEEFFKNVVLKLGDVVFYEKFSFINEGHYKIERDLTEAVERILRIS